MGQKVHPHSFRVGVIRGWDSRWIAPNKKIGNNLIEDYKIRRFIKSKLYTCGISKIEIEKVGKKAIIFIHTSKPGLIIGRGGGEIEKLKKELEDLTSKSVFLNIIEIKRPDVDAQLVAEHVALQLEKRTSFRKAVKQAIARAMKQGVNGIKIAVSGRLGGVEIARSEHYHEGTIPLQTLRADIHYGFAEAQMTYGKLGVKVWIYKGEVLNKNRNFKNEEKMQNVNAKKS